MLNINALLNEDKNMNIFKLLVDQTTGSIQFHINWADFWSSLRHSIFAAIALILTGLIAFANTLPANTIDIKGYDLTSAIVVIIVGALSMIAQYLSNNNK
jgi:hypothetical protein